MGVSATTRYVDVDGESVAYQIFGNGPDLCFVLGLSSHVDLRWSVPSVRRNLEALGDFARVISFDQRGMGASERRGPDRAPTWADWAEDLRHVLDAAGSTRSWLLTTLDGGPYAIAFAAAHPNRVRGLILGNTAARFLWAEDFPEGVSRDEAEIVLAAVQELWGTDAFASLMASDDSEEHAALATLQRASATPVAARAHLERVIEGDVRAAAECIQAPTTVFHRVDHPFIPVRLGRDLAQRVPGAEFVELPGSRGLFDEDDRAEVLQRVVELVTGAAGAPLDGRRLAAVVFCDIVGSTERAVALGDAEWRRVLDRHDATTRRVVERHAGRLVKFTGDGTLAIFDRPSRAVEAALDLRDALHDAGITVRAGVHVGELELRAGDLAGISVHVAERIQAAAAPSQVAVSRTVVDLVAGSGLAVTELGTFELKGVPGQWPLFTIARSSP